MKVKCRGAQLTIDRSLVIRLSFVKFAAIRKKISNSFILTVFSPGEKEKYEE